MKRLCNTSTCPSGVIVFFRKYDTFEKNLAKFFTNFFAFFSLIHDEVSYNF